MGPERRQQEMLCGRARPGTSTGTPVWQAPGRGHQWLRRYPVGTAGLDKSGRSHEDLPPIQVGLVVRPRKGQVFGTGHR